MNVLKTRAVCGAACSAVSLLADPAVSVADPCHDYSVTCAVPDLAPPSAGARFGQAVANMGDVLAVVGGSEAGPPVVGTGNAFLIDSVACGSVAGFPVMNPVPAAGDQYGAAVAGVLAGPASAPFVVVGTPFDDVTGLNSGIAYVRMSPVWAPLTLINPTPAMDDHFGAAVAAFVAANPRAVIGAPLDNLPVVDTGHVYTFNALNGAPLLDIPNPTPGMGDQFGFAVATNGTNILVGAPFDDTVAPDAGAVYLFDGLTGAMLCTSLPPGGAGAAGAHFGSAVAGQGGKLVIGAPGIAPATTGGVAFVYECVAGVGMMTAQFINPTPAPSDLFGSSVAIGCGGQVLVGDPSHDLSAAATDVGAAYVFDGSSSSPPAAPLDILANPAPVSGDQFGAAVAIVGNRILIGTPGDDTAGADAGMIYRFALSADCNGDCVLDSCDIASGASLDCDGSGVPDECEGIVCIVAANPPLDNPFSIGSQPFRDILQNVAPTTLAPQGIGMAGTPPEGTVTYSTLSVTFSAAPSPAPAPANITLSCTDTFPPVGGCPTVTTVAGGPTTYTLTLSGQIPTRECTTLTFAGTPMGQAVRYQFLPADFNFSGTASATDITALLGMLSSGDCLLPANLARCDINRGGTVGATDLARLVQLLNGVLTTEPWTSKSVAACP